MVFNEFLFDLPSVGGWAAARVRCHHGARDAERGPLVVGEDVTIGHNVRIRSCQIGNRCLIGMGSEVCDNVVVEDGAIVGARAYVEPGTVVKAGYIWAGRPATEFRAVKPEEHKMFQRGTEVYVGYSQTYLEG